MARRVYATSKKFGAASLAVIDYANQICSDYRSQGFDLTLRQLYYQFVSRDLIRNKDSEYKRLGSIINEARMAGLLDWNYIVDRTRNLKAVASWENPQAIIDAVAAQFRTDAWERQPEYVEVWIEKDALAGVLARVCPGNGVPYFSCRGYTSQSEMWSASQRILGKLQDGKKVTLLHLGDHDPSGIDMTRDIRDRLSNFVMYDLFRAGYSKPSVIASLDNFQIERIALNMDQIEEHQPPPNPAKITDSRANDYIEQYGYESWELDALSPADLSDLVQQYIDEHRDADLWAEAQDEDDEARRTLEGIRDNWDDVQDFLTGLAS